MIMAEKPDTNLENEEETINVDEPPKKKDKKKIEALENKIKELTKEVEKWKNEYYRAFADTKNLRNTLEKDHREALKYRAEGFIDSLLPVLDSFHLALGNEPTNPDLKNYLTGFQYIYRNLVSALESEGVIEISPKVGDKFDPSTMNAVDTVEDEGEENLVAKVYAKGYKLHDRLIRSVNVSVTVHPKKKEENTEVNETEA